MADGSVQVHCGDSAQQLRHLPDRSLDVAYLDADHRYEFVRRDLEAALPKMRDDGWIVVTITSWSPELHAHEAYGVVHAANEFMLANDWGIQYFALQTECFAMWRCGPPRC